MPVLERDSRYTFTGATEVLNGVTGKQLGASLKFYLVTIKNAGGTAVDITAEDDADNEVYEKIIGQFGGLAAYDSTAASGLIYVITDSHAAPDASVIEETIRAMGTSVGANGIDVSGTTVINGTSFTVS